jgi:hypothetical protein
MNKLMKWSIIATTSLPLLAFGSGHLTGGAGRSGQSGSNIRSIEGVVAGLETAIGWIQNIVLVLAVILILYAAFLYITSAGDEGKVGTAKKALLYAVIGIAIVLLANSITPIIAQLLQAG